MEITFKAQNETTKGYIESDSILQNKESKEAYRFGAWRRLGLEPLNFKFKTNDYRKYKR